MKLKILKNITFWNFVVQTVYLRFYEIDSRTLHLRYAGLRKTDGLISNKNMREGGREGGWVGGRLGWEGGSFLSSTQKHMDET